jgi:RNA polymerase sigma factor (sigma-70 family)
MEASALSAPASLARSRLSIGASLLRLRSDEQLVALFREGHDEAFRVIHDRYRTRLFAYTRQMLPGSRPDAEDALQDIFVRAYSGLRANDRQLSLRAWLYRVAHNRCVDELRKPPPPAPEVLGRLRAPSHDPTAEAEQRESLRRLIADVRRLPEQQRSALLMRELGGVAYCEVAAALGVSVPAVKSLLVRARVGLAQALEARDTACTVIREELAGAHDRGVRPSGIARRHMHDCAACREFRGQIRGVSRQFAALVPIGPLGVIANVLGIGGGAGTAAAGTGAAAAGGAAGTGGAIASIGALTGAGHVAALLAAAVVTAGGAVELQHSIAPTVSHRHHVHLVTTNVAAATPVGSGAIAHSALSIVPAASSPANSSATSTATPMPKSGGHARGAQTPPPPPPADSIAPGTGSLGLGIAATTTVDPTGTAAGTATGTTLPYPTGSATSTGTETTDPSGTGTSSDPAGTASGTGTSSAATDPSSTVATGDASTIGSNTIGTTAAVSSTTAVASNTTSPVASYPSGGVGSGGSRTHR